MRRVFVSEFGRLPISNMFDVDGDDTDDPLQANTLVAELPDGRWLAAKVFAGEIVSEALS